MGEGPLARATVDYNHQLDATSALRFSVMGHEQDVATRDHIKSDRRGLAVAYGTGIGTDLEWHLNYSYLKGDKTPDYGVPMAVGNDTIVRPIFSYGIPGLSDSTSYARSTDTDVTNTHVVTSDLTKQFDSFTLRNDTRISLFDRRFSSTAPGTVSNANLQLLLGGTNVALPYEAGGGTSYEQEGSAIQNVLTASGEFTLGGMRHKAQVGMDMIYQEESRVAGSVVNRVNNQTVLNPSHEVPGGYLTFAGTARNAHATEFGLFATDRVWVNDQVSVQGAVRWSAFKSVYNAGAGAARTETKDDVVSPSLAFIYEPNADTTLYASFARTYRPVGTDIASAIGDTPTATAYEPERSDVLEFGGKVDLFDGRLGLSGAAFQIKKSNSHTYDENGNLVLNSGDAGQSRNVKGVEFGVGGEISQGWSMNASYAYLDSEITAASNAALIGRTPVGVSRHNFSLWTSYEIPSEVVNLLGKLNVAGGVRFASDYRSNLSTSATVGDAIIPRTLSYDAMVGYETDTLRVALNGYNLTDEKNYGSSFNAYRAVPSTGRTFALTVSTKF